MTTIQAQEACCFFQLFVYPDQEFSFDLYAATNSIPGGVMAAYLPSRSDLLAVGNFLAAVFNNQSPSPIALSTEDGQRTLSMSASGSVVTITAYEANINTTLSVAFQKTFYGFMLTSVATLALIWAVHPAEDSAKTLT